MLSEEQKDLILTTLLKEICEPIIENIVTLYINKTFPALNYNDREQVTKALKDENYITQQLSMCMEAAVRAEIDSGSFKSETLQDKLNKWNINEELKIDFSQVARSLTELYLQLVQEQETVTHPQQASDDLPKAEGQRGIKRKRGETAHPQALPCLAAVKQRVRKSPQTRFWCLAAAKNQGRGTKRKRNDPS